MNLFGNSKNIIMGMYTQNHIPNSFIPYSFNGMEHDNEIKGKGNSYTTFFRQNDPRLGRWLSMDPKVTAFDSPYMSMGNNPINFNDIKGDVIEIEGSKKEKRQINRTINKGIKKSETFKNVYECLEQSSNLHIIRTGNYIDLEGKNQGSNLVVDGTDVYFNEKGALSIMYVNLKKFNPKKMDEYSAEGATVSKAEARIFGFGHELTHQLMKDLAVFYSKQTIIPSTIVNPSPSLKNPELRIKNPKYSKEKNNKIMLDNVNNTCIFDELGASMIENKIREDLNAKLRTKYNTYIKSSLGSVFDTPFTIDIINEEKTYFPNGFPIEL